MNSMSKFVLIAIASLSLVGCGGNEPLTATELLRKQQENQLAADREAQRLQNELLREQLRTQQLQNQAIQAGLYPQASQQPPAATAQPDDGIGMGTVMAGAAAAGALGYMSGKNSVPTNQQYYQQQYAQPRTQSRPASAPVIKRPITTTSRSTSSYRSKPSSWSTSPSRSSPTIRRYSSGRR